jgi:hypothetical protein
MNGIWRTAIFDRNSFSFAGSMVASLGEGIANKRIHRTARKLTFFMAILL